jgi:hypothetical protein
MTLWARLTSLLDRSARDSHRDVESPASPVRKSTSVQKVCMLCFEPGGIKRTCCRATYCDHCYVKNGACPNCKGQTKREKLTGKTYELKSFSEHEECRTCLDPGLLRRCCGNYYCDACFYAVPACRSCGALVADVNSDKRSVFNDRAYCISVCLGWLLTLFLILGITVFSAVVIAADAATPIGINDFHCYGFFRSCDVDGKYDDRCRELSLYLYCLQPTQ